MLKNKRVVKALTIGLATVLATPSMTAFAAAPGEAEPQAADDTVAAVAVDASAVTEVAPVEVKSDNRDEIDTAIKETKEALEAEKEANDAADDAVKNGLPQAGVVSLLEDNDVNVVTGARLEGWNLVLKTEDVDDSASENDQLVDDALSDAAKALDDGKEELEDKLEEFNDNAKESLGDSKEAVTDAYGAAGELLKVDDAKKAADAATNSGAAQAQADVAKEASENAAAFADKAETNASDAYDEFLAAKKNYEDAESIAKAANEAADKAIKEKRADAEEAVTYAKAAEFTAIGLKNEMEAAKKVAEGTQAYYEGELKKVEDNLKALGNAKEQLDKDHEYAQGQYNKEKALLDEMAGALKDAQDAYNGTISDWDVIAETWKIQGLEGALGRARAALAKAGYDQWQADKKVEQLELSQELKDAYELIEKAYAQALEEANKDAEEGKKVALEEVVSDNVTVISGKISDLKDAYGENIGDIQKTLLSSTASDDEKEAAVVSLIENITGLTATSFDSEGLFSGKLYKVETTDNEGKAVYKFYTYEISADGQILFAEVTRSVREIAGEIIAKDPKFDNGITQEEFDQLIAGLADGTYFYDTTTQTIEPQITGYTVTYTKEPFNRGYNYVDKVGTTGTISLVYQYYDWYHNLHTETHTFDVRYDVDQNGNEVWAFYYDEHYYYDDPQNGWYYLTMAELKSFFDYGRFAGVSSNADIYAAIKINNATETVNNVSEDNLKNYSNQKGYKATAVYSEGGTRTIYNVTSGILSQKDLDEAAKEALIAEIGNERVIKVVETKTEATSTTETVVKVVKEGKDVTRDNNPSDGPNGAPQLDSDGNYVNVCVFYYGNEVYSTVNGDLRWNASLNRWEVKKDHNPDSEFENLKTYYTRVNGRWTEVKGCLHGLSNTNHRVHEYQGATVVTMSPEEAKKVRNARVKITTEETVVVPGSVQYTVYYKDTEQGPSTTETTYSQGVSTGISDLATLSGALEQAESDLKKVQEYNKAQADYDAAVKAAKEAKDKYDAAKAEKDRLKGEVKKAKDDLDAAIKDKAEKYWALERAKAAYNWQSYKTDGAEAALKDIEWKLRNNAWFTRLNEIAKTQLEKDIDDAKKSVTAWTKKAEIAKDLADKATKARVEAEEARDAYNKIGKSNLGAAALAQAKARLDQAEAAATVAQAAAEQARKDADEAASEYQQILARVQALIDAENAAAGEGEGAGEGETTTGGAVVLATIPTGEEVPGAPAAPAAGGAGVAANVAPAAVEAATTDITTPDTALSAAVPEDNKAKDDLTQIMPQAPALAADIADTEHLTWWWLLVVAVLGGTGYAMYKKFQTKKEEKVTK